MELDDRYALADGTVFMTGVQALVRLPVEQARRDRAAGLRTGTFISGYPGSPLAGYDLELARARRWLDEAGVRFAPGLNEEVAAASVWGSQMTELFGSAWDGVTGIWYGKSPGVDRCLDVFKHANLGGGPRHSALLALAADDPGARSSTLPNDSTLDFVACGMPVLCPGTVAELLELGLHGIALSRLTGLWVACRCVTGLCDAGASVRVGPERPRVVLPELDGFRKPQSFHFYAPGSIELERHLHEERLPAALAYARANRLDEVVLGRPGDRLGVVAAGRTCEDVLEALRDLGVPPAPGVRVLRLRMVHPLDARALREFARGLDEVVVVEEKGDLVETRARAALYEGPDRPRVTGKRDAAGRPWFPWHGELDADAVAERLGPLLLETGAGETARRRLREIAGVRGRPYQVFSRRTPNYCPGCPHSRSTVSPEGGPVGGGAGCQGIAPLVTQAERQIATMAPMGAEGAAFIGLAPFAADPRFVQNVGDGTFFHSASQSLRACVAAGVDVTFKLLYNHHVAMTGGQDVTGGRDVAALTRYLESEGVTRTIVVSERPRALRGRRLAAGASVWARERLDEAARELRRSRGVTVLVFDQRCAAEKRRARRRGRLPAPSRYVFINEDVCEGCGDCGAKSNCMAVEPVETELGRKTRIDQGACTADHACLSGDCPAFLLVSSRGGPARRAGPGLAAGAVPEPERRAEIPADGYRVLMAGVGGTGVVTANQVLAWAALLEGRPVRSLDQTGLSQKGGAVISSLVIARDDGDLPPSGRVGVGRADLVLALDALGAAGPVSADRMSPERTVVAGDATLQPTADAVRHVELLMPGRSAVQLAVDRWSRAGENVWVEAGRLAEAVFGDRLVTNMLMLGVAYQAGRLPVAAASIEAAIGVNGVEAERNVQAFRTGRLLRHDPAACASAPAEPGRTEEGEPAPPGRAHARMMERASELDERLRRMLSIRLGELVRYQDARYARRYLDRVLAVWRREREVVPGRHGLTEAAIRHLHRLMAYKDEYEVARLLLKPEWTERLERTFVRPRALFMLQPPFLRRLGLRGKLALGAWSRPLLGLLVAMRRLRGTALDPFGRTAVRRTERELVTWYESLLDELGRGLTPENHRLAVEIATAPDRIRGYEDVKLRGVAAARAHVDRLLPLPRSRSGVDGGRAPSSASEA